MYSSFLDRWSKLIGTSRETMDKFKLQLWNNDGYWQLPHKVWTDEIDVILSLKRRFVTIDVTLEDNTHEPSSSDLFAKIAASCGSQVRKLIMHDAVFKNSSTLNEILKSMPLLEEIEIRELYCSSASYQNQEPQPVTLYRLKTLKISNVDWKFFQHLNAPNITTFEVDDSEMNISENSVEFIKNFLESSRGLESLGIEETVIDKIFSSKSMRRFTFKLKKLDFQNNDQADRYFSKFLASQASSLEELEIQIGSREIYDVIFRDMRCLKTLRMNMDTLPTDKEFYDRLKPIKSLKEIFSNFGFSDEVSAKGVLGNCPNLEVLNVTMDSNGFELLPFIAINNPKITTLSIKALRDHISPDIKFESLKRLQLYEVRNVEFLLTFIRNNPAVETLSIWWIDEDVLQPKDLDILMEESNLKHLKFMGECETMKAIYDKLKVDYKNLKSLELCVNYGSLTGMPVLYFEFPEDSNKWNPHCEYFDNPQ